MQTQKLVCKMKTYIQPFERQLAIMELEAIAGSPPVPETWILDDTAIYHVNTTRTLDELLNTLTYWEIIGIPESANGRFTRQVLRESTANVVRNGVTLTQIRSTLPFDGKAIPVPNRRVLRYGPHGAHEYRGKFFPQLVRSLLNIANIKPKDIVLDPMCGSGTTLVEASLFGCRAIGVDINPLSVFMSRVKCDVLKISPEMLVHEYETLKSDFLNPPKSSRQLIWLRSLREEDQRYLQRWFSPQVLSELDYIAIRVNNTPDAICRNLFWLCVSNILRRVSWQKEADLRVRKEIRPDRDIDVIGEYLTELNKTVRIILAFLYQEKKPKLGDVEVFEGDARFLLRENSSFGQFKGRVSAIVTSPPYATALPYLDTDRLSLCFLGLLSRPEHRHRDYLMIGNREITERQRQMLWAEYQQNRSNLPSDITDLIDHIQMLNESSTVGFRRLNLGALLAHYFLDMQLVFQNMQSLLMPNMLGFVVIGNNHTIAGGNKVDIETDRFLGLIGKSVGLNLEQTISMEMLVSRDIFKNNAVGSETILCFRKPTISS